MRRRTAKEHGETSCVEELKKSEGFMKEMRQKYAALVELARKGEECEGRMIVEVMEEEEEGYYTQLVHLLHGVLGKDVE